MFEYSHPEILKDPCRAIFGHGNPAAKKKVRFMVACTILFKPHVTDNDALWDRREEGGGVAYRLAERI